MLERKLMDLDFEGPMTDCGLDGEGVNQVRALLVAAQSAGSRDRSTTAIDEEAERLVELDPVAAQRALDMLRFVRERLAKAMSESRMAGVLSEALVRAADALPEQFEAQRG